MPTLMQKIRLALRGWNRRREEKEKEFLAKNLWSGAPPPPAAPLRAAAPHLHIDLEGLTVAYLDDSGQIHHYLDIETGDVIDTRESLAGARYRSVPSRQSDADDRRAFIDTLDESGARARLTAAQSFRSELARDRALERAWYNFRNDRAIAAIERWLREIGVK